MASRRSSSNCALCERSNLPSCCSACVNARLGEYHARLRMMRNLRDSLHSRIAARLEAKRKADEQRSWRAGKAQDIKVLRDRLSELTRRNAIEKKVERASSDLRARTASLNLAFVMLKKKQADSSMMHTNAMKAAQMGLMATTSERLKRQSKAIKQLCRLFPMRRVHFTTPQYCSPYPICTSPSCIRLWGFMFTYMAAEFLLEHKTVPEQGLPLFIPRQNNCSVGEENSWTESGSGNFGVDSVDSDKKPFFDSKRSNSFNFSAASSHSMERHPDLQKGISLLKTSVTAITAYYYNSLGLDVPSDLSTFEAFAKLLHMLSSSKALRAALESNIASRSEKQAQQLNRSTWKASSAISSNSSLMDSMHTAIMPSSLDNLLLNSDTSFLYTGKPAKYDGAPDSILDGWDLVEREILPPPPSQAEDVEQWERAHTYPRSGSKKK